MVAKARETSAGARKAGRRAKGEGSLYRRSDGRWVGRVTQGGVSRSYYARTRIEAARKLQTARLIAHSSGTLPDLAATVGTVIDVYRDEAQRPSSKLVDPDHVPAHLATIEAGVGTHQVAFLTAGQVRADLLEPLAAEVDEETFHEVHATLCDVLDYAQQGYALGNPAERRDALPTRFRPSRLD